MAASAPMLLAACGGSGGVDPPGGNVPSAGTPSPTPSSTAVVSGHEASHLIASAKAACACDRGVTGKDVTVAVFDQGIKAADRLFADRMSSGDTAFDEGIVHRCAYAWRAIRFNVEGDGSRLARIAAAARDYAGMREMARVATIPASKLSPPYLVKATPASKAETGGDGADLVLIAPAILSALDGNGVALVMGLSGASAGWAAAERRASTGAGPADRSLAGPVSNGSRCDAPVGTTAADAFGIGRVSMNWLPFAIGVTENGLPRFTNGSAGAAACGHFRARSPPEPTAAYH